MNSFARAFPWIVLVFGAVLLLWQARPASSDGSMNVHEFGKIPIVDGGRIKPYDTLARNSLMVISDRSTWVDERGDRRPAIEWLLDVIADPQAAARHRVFRIENMQVLDMLGLDNERPGFRYALAEFNSDEQLREIFDQARRANEKEDNRSLFDRKILELWNQMQLHQRLAVSHQIPNLRAIESREQLMGMLQQYQQTAQMQIPLAVPPGSGEEEEDWEPLMQASLEADLMAARAMMNEQTPEEMDPSLQSLRSIFAAYQRGDAASFNQEVAAYRARLASTMPDALQKAGVESWFRQFSPFYYSAILYVLAFLLGCFAWLGWAGPLNKAAFWLAGLTLVVHTGALIMRMWLDGRPPVTNLYSSALFIGWGCVGLGLLLEWVYRNGIGTIVAAVTGSLSLLVAINLASDGSDKLGVMVAVLDTNFWLATHVTTVTLGYTATFVAGFLGIIFVLFGLFTRILDKDMLKTLGGMIYGVICFGLFLSFIGTVLGGIWADQSWGRFWGWDPKENGALIIVLWNALILHARWGGMVQQRGVAVLAIFGNVVTAWSWFGVNELGAGLHSYGFTEGTRFYLSMFVLSQLLLIALGSLPMRMWRSSTVLKSKKPKKPRPASGASGGDVNVSPAS